MKRIKIEELDVKEFSTFGYYADLSAPSGESIGSEPIRFFRDLLPARFQSDNLTVSVCQVSKRPMVIDTVEYHDHTAEGILSLDGDIYVHLAPASPGDCDLNKIRVFRVPAGTMLIIRPGVWHHAPYAVDKAVCNVLIFLPERTYKIDCNVRTLDEDEMIRFG